MFYGGNMKITQISILILLIFLPVLVCSEEYNATVTTSSGSYDVTVEVEDGEVTYVHWPNGGDMSVSGAEIDDGEADGYNSRGDSVHVEVDDYEEGEE